MIARNSIRSNTKGHNSKSHFSVNAVNERAGFGFRKQMIMIIRIAFRHLKMRFLKISPQNVSFKHIFCFAHHLRVNQIIFIVTYFMVSHNLCFTIIIFRHFVKLSTQFRVFVNKNFSIFLLFHLIYQSRAYIFVSPTICD